MIHTVKDFGIVNKAEVDVFLKLLCFFDDPVDVSNLVSGSSVQFSHSVVSDSLQPHGLQHTRPPCPSPLPEFTQTHVHWVGDAIQPSHLLSSPSVSALNLSQHQGLFTWVRPSHQVAKVLEFQLSLLNPPWTSGSSWFSDLAGLENSEHYFASMWDECNCVVVWTFFGFAFLWDWNENWPFSVLWSLLSFPNLLAYWVQHFHSSIF